MTTDNRAFLNGLKEYIMEVHPSLHHPFIKKMTAGELSREQVAGWAREFWGIAHTHLINNAGKVAHAQLWRGSWMMQLMGTPYDKEITAILGSSLADELGHTDLSPVSHYDPYLWLLEDLGISDEHMKDTTKLLGTTVTFAHCWTTSALHFSLLEILASHNFVNDTVNPTAYPRIEQALRQHYGVSKKGAEWFALHGEVDVEHGTRAEQVIRAIIKTDEDRLIVKHCVNFGLGMRKTLYDGIYDAYVAGIYGPPRFKV